MPRYYFEIRDGDACTFDDEGLELDGIDAARDEAARTLGEIARDVLPGSVRRVLGLTVRDEAQEPLFEARLVFDVVPHT
jgi:hypothetical protein